MTRSSAEGSKSRRAVLLLAHGAPESVEQVPEFLRYVVGGRPLAAELVREIERRYALVGRSPLTDWTLRQAELLAGALAESGSPAPVYVGMRNWRPFLADTLAEMRAAGVAEAAVLCLAPQNSRTSVGLYRRAVEAEAGAIRLDFTPGWAAHPLLIEAFAERLRACWGRVRTESGERAPVLFTAHSVPVRTVQPAPDSGERPDPYAEETLQTARLVAAQLPELPVWSFAFQSQGAGGGPWLGPTVEEKLAEFAAAGQRRLVLQPIGFLCDHVEVLYDIDVDFRARAAALGIQLERPESLNASPLLTRALADLALEAFGRLGK